MITSTIDICNMALDYCNVKNITSLEEETKAAKKCSLWYDTVRKSLLLNMNASFSLKRAVLTQDVKAKIVFGYEKAYALPSDCLKVLWVNSPVNDKYYPIEGLYILCDADTSEEQLKIKYISDVKDVTKYDSEFSDCLALRLAEKICYSLTEDTEKANYLRQLAQAKYIETSSKYGSDNKMIVINKPKYRQAKYNAEIQDCNYYAK